jgi:polysaccharide export outer membrane protein
VREPYRRLASVMAALLMGASGAAAQAAPTRETNFVIGPNDRLRITVWNQANISGDYNVERDGTFTFPLIGRVDATGLTVERLETELRRLLADGFYKNPQVTAAIIENRSRRVYVMGELRTPGTYPITGDVSLIEALAKAGSITAASADHALIIRSPNAQGPVVPGQDASAEVTRVDLRRLNGGLNLSDVIVRDGDTVFVPRASSVFISGQVRNPGSYPITQDTTVRQALALAGGVSEYAASNRIKIVRVADGRELEVRVKLNDRVRAGDTLVVPERFF